MPPKDKTQPPPTPFNGPTAVSPSPFAGKAQSRPAGRPMAPDITAPGQPPTVKPTNAASLISEIVSVIGGRRPDLVEALLNIDDD